MQVLKEFHTNAQKILLGLEKTQKEFWNIDRDTANFLNMLVKIHNSKNALEIGTSNGYSAIWLADALRHTGGKLTTIEFWDKRQSIAKETKLNKACASLLISFSSMPINLNILNIFIK